MRIKTNTPERRSRPAAAGLLAALITGLVAATMAVLATPASAAVPGLTIVNVTSATDSDDQKDARAECPGDTVAIGSGATIEGGRGQVVIESVVPSSVGVSASAYEATNGTNSDWSVTAQAICADPLPNHFIVSATSPQDSSSKDVTVDCPGDTVTVGSGALLLGGFGDVEIEELRPEVDSVTVTGHEIGNGTGAAWGVVAYASCADPLAGLVTVSASSAKNAVNKNVVAPCPAGTQVLTAAGGLDDGDGRVVVDDLFADDTTVTATGKETGNGTASSWRVQAIALCATP